MNYQLVQEAINSNLISPALKKELQILLKNAQSGTVFALPSETQFLKRIISDKVCAATDGKRLIADQTKLFPGSIDGDFKNWNLNTPREATVKTSFDVYELTRDGNGASIFHSFERPLTELCFTLPQIIEIVENNSDVLHPDGNSTVFLITDGNGNYFRVYVWNGASYRSVSVDRLEYVNVWNAEGRRRFVIPQQVSVK